MNESEDVAGKPNSLVTYILINFVACVALLGPANLQGDQMRIGQMQYGGAMEGRGHSGHVQSVFQALLWKMIQILINKN